MSHAPDPADIASVFREPRLAVTLLRPLVRALVAANLDAEAVLARAGLALEQLEDAELRVPHRRAVRLLELAVAEAGDPAFALRCASHVDVADLGFIGLLLATAPTVGDAIRRVQRYGRLLHDAAADFGELRGGRYMWHLRLMGLAPEPLVMEVISAATVARMRLRCGHRWRPDEMWFAYPEPAYSEVYVRTFGCDCRFGAEENAMLIDAGMLELPNVGLGAMSELVERRAQALLEEVSSRAGFADVVRRDVSQALARADIGADAVAARLCVSRATLSRRLQREGTSLREVVDELRRDLALEYLRDPSLALEELARRLGLSDARAFRRAFLRWTGKTPADYRRTLT